MSSPAAHDGRSWSIARLASGTLVLLALAGSHMDVSLLPAGTSRPAASASLLTEEQMGRFQVRIRGMGPQGVAPEAPDRPVNEAPSPVAPIQRVERVEPAAEPPAKPAGAAAAWAPAEEPRWRAAGRACTS